LYCEATLYKNFNVEGAENMEVAGDLTYPGTNTSGIGGA